MQSRGSMNADESITIYMKRFFLPSCSSFWNGTKGNGKVPVRHDEVTEGLESDAFKTHGDGDEKRVFKSSDNQ